MADTDRSSTAAGSIRLLVILLLGSAATFPYLSRSSTSATPASSAANVGTATGQQNADPPMDALKLLGEFAGVDAGDPELALAAAQPVSAELPEPLRQEARRRALVKAAFQRHGIDELDFIIATVPDPIDSNARWTFDTMAGVLQSAAAANEYVLDRFYIPDWDPTRDGPGTAASGRRVHESWPALILFRDANFGHEGGNRRLLLLLLVAETPTGGIHQAAFRNALETIANWHDGTAPTISVLGPNFSGSVPSLALAIRNFQQKHPAGAMHIITGGATADTNKGIIERTKTDQFHVRFTSTVIPDGFTKQKTIEYLIETDDELLDRQRLALLVEDNTTYGTLLQGRSSAEATACRTVRRKDRPRCVLDSALVFPFPLHISRLRSNAAAQATRPSDNRPRFLTLPLAEPGTATDQIPSLTPQSTSASVEIVLNNILDTIVRKHITTVGLLATDTRDKLFLAEQIARRDSRVRLFTIESDVFYTHPDYGPYVRGMIVASTYPLFSQVQGWTGANNREIQFPTTNVQGVYNAFVALLREQRPELQDIADPLDYRTPLSPTHAPPLWISAVGRNSLWPLRWYMLAPPVEQTSDTANTIATYIHPLRSRTATVRSVVPHASTTSAAVFWALTLIVLSHVAAFTTKRWWPVRYHHRPFLELFTPATTRRMPYLLIAFGALTVLYGYLAAVLVSVAPRGFDAVQQWGLSGTAAAALVVLACLFACVLRLTRNVIRGGRPRLRHLLSLIKKQSKRRRLWAIVDPQYWLMVVAAVWVTVAVYYGVQYLIATISLDRRTAAYYFERVAHPSNGLSPAMPLIYLSIAVYFWAAVHLRRLSRVSGQDMAAALKPLVTLPLDSLRRSTADMQRFIDGAVQALPRGLTAALFALSLAVTAFSLLHSVASPEPETFVNAFKSAWVVLQILLLITFAHVIYFWRLIRRTIEPFDGTPMIEAFDDLPPHLLHDRLTPRRPGPADVRRVTFAANELGLQLKHMPTTERAAFCEAVGLDAAEYKALRRRLRRRPRGFDDTSEWAASRRWKSLIVVMRDVVPPVSYFWRRGRHQSRKSESAKTAGLTQRWVWLAEETIAMQTLLVVRELLARLAQLFFFLIVGVLLMVAIAQSFPFQPRQQLLATAWVYVIGAVVLVITTFVQIERDPVISALASTDSGKINWDWTVWTKVLLYGALPIATIFAAQFPQLGGTVLDFLRPVQSVIP